VRNYGSKASGGEWTHFEKVAVWNRGKVIPGQEQNVYRGDACGSVICWDQYGDTSKKWGWEVDHIVPVSRGGGDGIGNLQPLQWQNNRAKGDGPLKCG
jgi:5-methylcytosine-specific restriction endonuclease McrA